jgi:hypothetical protein
MMDIVAYPWIASHGRWMLRARLFASEVRADVVIV